MREEALEAARMIALRLARRTNREQADRRSKEQTAYPELLGETLSSGDLGVMVLLYEIGTLIPSERNLFHDAASEIAQEYLVYDAPGTDFSALSGAGGTMAALADAWQATRDSDIRAALEKWKDGFVDEVLGGPPLNFERGCSADDYDLVTGRAGQFLCLQHIADVFPGDAEIQASASVLRDDLVAALDPSPIYPDFPSCWIHPDYYGLEDPSELPNGYVNLGLAHGLPGIVGALATVGPTEASNDSRQAVIGAVRHLLKGAHGSPPTWGSQMPIRASISHQSSRVAWCYGTPGVASALAAASRLLEDEGLRTTASRSMETALYVSRPESGLISASFCHGEAGVIACALSVFGSSPSTLQEHLVAVHVGEVLGSINPSTLLGVQDIEAPGRETDAKGFLSGATGIAHALLRYVFRDELPPTAFDAVTLTKNG